MFRAKLPAFLFLLGLLIAPASWAVPTKILPLGDSITGEYSGDSAYRDELFDLLTNAGYDFEFVGSLTDIDATSSNGTKHEGHSGWRSDEINANINNWLASYEAPDIALIHLGTNDILQPSNTTGNTTAETMAALQGIVNKLYAVNNFVEVLVAKLIPLGRTRDTDYTWDPLTSNWVLNANAATDLSIDHTISLNSAIEAATWVSGGSITIVDQNTLFTTNEMDSDLIHPNLAGEVEMANRWFTKLVASGILAPQLTLTSSLATTNGPSFTVTATSTAPAGSSGTITYSTDSTGICAVDQATGEVTPQAAGDCIIDATQAAVTDYAEAIADPITVTITDSPQEIKFATSTPTNKLYGDIPFIVNATSTSTLPVTITSATPTVCTIHPTTKTVTLLKAGTCTLEANQSGDVVGAGNSAKIFAAAVSVTHTITVNKAPQTISFAGTPTAKTFGDAAFTATATSDSGLSVTVTSTTQNVCTIDATNTVTIHSAGACTLSASQAGNDNYLAATSSTHTITVSSAGQTIDFPEIEDKIFGIAPFQISATASSGLPVSFSSSTTSICTVSESTVTLESVGTCKLTATAGDSNTGTATANREFKVLANDEGNAKASLIEIINNDSTNDVTASQLIIIGLTEVNADLDYTQALKEGTYADKDNPTLEELQKVIDDVNGDEIKTAGSVSGLWLFLLGFAALYRRHRMSLKP